MVGISFNLIIIRVDRANHSSTLSNPSVGASSYPLRYIRSEGAGMTSQRNVEIMISRDVAFSVSASEPEKKDGSALGGRKSDVDSWNAV